MGAGLPDPMLLVALFGGLLLLAISGDLLVRGALSLGRSWGVSPLVAGVVIVGFGTSAPELFVSVSAALSGNPGLALGNIVGSNIANVFLAIGLPVLLFPVIIGGQGQGRAVFAMVLATVLWIAMTALMPLSAMIGVFFLCILIGYCGLTLLSAGKAQAAGIPSGFDEDDRSGPPLWRALIYVPLGIAGLFYASYLIIPGAEGTARALRVPEEWIGLTLLAVGTSLPEIGAGVASAFRKRGDVLVGNVLGGNIFNILGAGGIVALSGPVEVASGFLKYDHWIMGASAILFGGLVLMRVRAGRLLGLLFLLLYAVYIYGLVTGINLLGLASLVTG